MLIKGIYCCLNNGLYLIWNKINIFADVLNKQILYVLPVAQILAKIWLNQIK